MFGIGGFELFLIIVFAFLIIGPDKLPEIAKSAGKAVAKFRDAKNEVDKVIKTEVYDPNAEDPFKAPIDTLQKMSDSVENAKTGETFSERKARYDAQRAEERKAAQKAKQAQEAAEAAAAAEAAEAAEAAGAAGAAEGVAPKGQSASIDPAALFSAQPVVPVTGGSEGASAVSAPEAPAAPAAPAVQTEEGN